METKKANELSIEGLKSFIDKAVKLGKYPANTASGYLAAIKTVERAILDDEPKTIDYLLSHIEELFIRQTDLQLSPQSVPVYIGRIRTVCKDYKTYGADGSSIYRWSRTIRKRKEKIPEQKESNNPSTTPQQDPIENNFSQSPVQNSNGTKLNIVSWRLRPGVVVRIELPEDLTEQDVKKIKALLDIELGVGL